MITKKPSTPQIKVRCITSYDDHVPDFYHTFRCKSSSIVEALAEEVPYWHPRHPVLIDAPPGLGKTHFVYSTLIPRAIELGGNLLLLSNRVALSLQQKREIMDILDVPFRNYLTDEGIRKTSNFGRVRVITYHQLPALLNEPKAKAWLDSLHYVVADEIHMVSADSFFNEKCGYYLSLITSKFQHAIRVYLTATSWDVLYPLGEAEKRHCLKLDVLTGHWDTSREFRRYVFDADFSHVDLEFFDKSEELKELIRCNPAEKWIIFFSSCDEGYNFAKSLGKNAIFLDASSKETGDWAQILKAEKFEQQVLCTTAALDCGVNFHDAALTHIAVTTDSRTSLIQMLGRKRRSSPGEKIKLHVCNLTKKKIARRYEECLQIRNKREEYDMSDPRSRKRLTREFWHSEDSRLRHFFDLVNGSLVPNQLAFFMLKRKMQFYEMLLEGKITFQEAVRSWLGICEKEKKESPLEKLLRFCENNVNLQLDEEKIAMFRKLVVASATEHAGRVEPQPSRVGSLKATALRNRLRMIDNCPYTVDSDFTIKLFEEE